MVASCTHRSQKKYQGDRITDKAKKKTGPHCRTSVRGPTVQD